MRWILLFLEWKNSLRLHYMMKTLISSFFTFLLIYIQRLEVLDCRKFFSKILKCVRNITKNVVTAYSFAAKVVIVIDNMWLDVILDTGYVTFNLACVFVVHDRSSTAFSFGQFRSVCIAIPFLHLCFADILASFFVWFLACTVCDKLIMSEWHLKPLPKHTLLILIRLQFDMITESGKSPPNLISSFTEIEIFSDRPHKNSLETRTFYPIPSKLGHNVEQ
jgi:hypothetical protein